MKAEPGLKIEADSRRRLSRAEKAAETRRTLLKAAAYIVGKEGYSGASIGRIAERGGVAPGTFYNYFSSQQDIFDQLLPAQGEALAQYVRERVAAAATDDLAREEARFRAFFDYLHDHPEYYRIMQEAHAVSPDSFRVHQSEVVQGYLAALKGAQKRGLLRGFDERDLEAIVFILIAARPYLAFRYTLAAGGSQPLPEWLAQLYRKFIGPALLQDAAPDPARGPVALAAVGAERPAWRVVSAGDGEGLIEAGPLGAGETMEVLARLLRIAADVAAPPGDAGPWPFRDLSISLLVADDLPSLVRVHARLDRTADDADILTFRVTRSEAPERLLAIGHATSRR